MSLFNSDIILFTDASVNGKVDTKNGNNVCSGVSVYEDLVFKETLTFPFKNATNNFGELFAICKALEVCNVYREYYNIRNFIVFSDSLYSIDSLRTWVKSWYYKQDSNFNIYTSNGTLLKNRKLLDRIIYFTINKLRYCTVQLLHCKSHNDDPQRLVDDFVKTNKRFMTNVNNTKEFSIEFQNIAPVIMEGNDRIDNETRNVFRNSNTKYMETNEILIPIRQITPSDIDIYRGIIH